MWIRSARISSVNEVKGHGYKVVCHIKRKSYTFIVAEHIYIDLNIKSNGEAVYEYVKYEDIPY